MGRTSDCSKMSRRTVQYWITECRYSLIRYEGRGRGRIVQNFILVSQNWAFLLHPAVRCAILIIEKGKTTAHKGLTSYKMVIELPPCYWSKFWGGFLCLKHYVINVNTNVSNARMNIPKAIRSLKSKCFISTTPILCKNRDQPPCNTVVFLGLILPYRSCLCNRIILFSRSAPFPAALEIFRGNPYFSGGGGKIRRECIFAAIQARSRSQSIRYSDLIPS